MKKNQKRGGARKGAGRKRTGHKTILAGFSLSKEILHRLRTEVPLGQRSNFVEVSIIDGLEKRAELEKARILSKL
jgi:hypothetical protein